MLNIPRSYNEIIDNVAKLNRYLLAPFLVIVTTSCVPNTGGAPFANVDEINASLSQIRTEISPETNWTQMTSNTLVFAFGAAFAIGENAVATVYINQNGDAQLSQNPRAREASQAEKQEMKVAADRVNALETPKNWKQWLEANKKSFVGITRATLLSMAKILNSNGNYPVDIKLQQNVFAAACVRAADTGFTPNQCSKVPDDLIVLAKLVSLYGAQAVIAALKL